MKLHNKITLYNSKNFYPLHMPGHKRRGDIFSEYDFTEVPMLDDLHDPKEDIKELMNNYASKYKSKWTYLSTNGSTSGILAMVCAAAQLRSRFLVGRNCHKSVYNAIHISNIDVEYIYPHVNREGIVIGYDYDDIEKMVDELSIEVMIFTTPTYEGMILDKVRLKAIAEKYDAMLLLDEAHGAHLFDASIADISVMSTHKTLPALTSTSIIHCNNDDINEYLKKYLSIFITSSPSYILLKSLSECLEFIEDEKKFFEFNKVISYMRNKLKSLKKLRLIDSDDIFKIVISTIDTDINGKDLYYLLYNEGFVLEMYTDTYVIAMLSICDDVEMLNKFLLTLINIDKKLKRGVYTYKFNFRKLDKRKPCEKNIKYIDVSEAFGEISAGLVYLYPPGIPLISYNEIFNKEVIRDIEFYHENKIIDSRSVAIYK